MAAGGLTHNRQTFWLPTSKINLTVTEGSIIETSAEVLATGEDNSLMGHGGISQLLLKNCPSAYKSARDKLKRDTKKFEFGKIYPCNFPSHRDWRRSGVSFNVVLHAIVPSAKVVTNQKEWMDQMKGLYYNLFKAANDHGRASLALPLLGSGGAGASIDVAADVLAHALTTFRMKLDSRAPKQSLRDIVLYVRKEAFSKMVPRLEGKLRGMPLPNGTVRPTSGRATCGRSKPRTTSSSSSRSRTPGSAGGTGRTDPTLSGRIRSTPAGAASAPGSRPPVQSDMSNMMLILQGMTLESAPKQREEEDMDCDEDVYYSSHEEEAKDSGGQEDDDDEDKCAICLDVMDDPKKLDKCGHTFCRDCIEHSFRHHKPVCPSCNTLYGMITGNQPNGTMRMSRNSQSLPGYEGYGQIVIDYDMPSGIQGPEHVNPGQRYHGTRRQAFLPDSLEGRKVYRLLRVAFENRLTFTIGHSVTTGADNVVTWNDIHHKTRPHGGATGFGYPDPHYLSRVQEELAAKGITEKCLEGRTFDL